MPPRPHHYRRREDVDLREVDGEAFLLDQSTGRIHHLNMTGAAVWRLLAEPMTLNTIVRVFADAFPERTDRAHKKMLKALLEELEENDLLAPRES